VHHRLVARLFVDQVSGLPRINSIGILDRHAARFIQEIEGSVDARNSALARLNISLARRLNCPPTRSMSR
jgi:hypothetical protein